MVFVVITRIKSYTWHGLTDAREKGNQGQAENKKGDKQWKRYSRQSMHQ